VRKGTFSFGSNWETERLKPKHYKMKLYSSHLSPSFLPNNSKIYLAQTRIDQELLLKDHV